jgi:hypothetical protein
VEAIEHEDGKIARVDVHWPAAERLRTTAPGLRSSFHRRFSQFGMRFADVVDVPVGDRWSIRRKGGLVRRVVAEGHRLLIGFLSVSIGYHRQVVEMARENGLRLWIDIDAGFGRISGHVSDQRGGEQKHRKHFFHGANPPFAGNRNGTAIQEQMF